MPRCRDCGNAEDFTAIEEVYSRLSFDKDDVASDTAIDSELIDYISSTSLSLTCYECNGSDVSTGEDAQRELEEANNPSINEFIARNSKLLV